jgi:transcriptional regulator with XRE-family HTH domain
MKNIGEKIKVFRNENNYSQNDLAEILEVRQEYISYWEKGLRPIPEEVMKTMVEAGVIPDRVLSTPERIKTIAEGLTYEDQTLLENFAKRMLS